MHHIAQAALVTSALLSCCAIGFLLTSSSTSKSLLVISISCTLVGVGSTAANIGDSTLAFWAFLFSAAAAGCGVSAMFRLFARSARWVHRCVIYGGYAATFAMMGVVALCLSSRGVSGRLSAIILASTYVVGSIGIFLAKTTIVRVAARTMPEYQTSLNSVGSENQSYW